LAGRDVALKDGIHFPATSLGSQQIDDLIAQLGVLATLARAGGS
jgi:hypothetical protein